MRSFSVFEEIDKRLLYLIILFEPAHFANGAVIYNTGDETNYLYLIKKGSVCINRVLPVNAEKALLRQVREEVSSDKCEVQS